VKHVAFIFRAEEVAGHAISFHTSFFLGSFFDPEEEEILLVVTCQQFSLHPQHSM
jgi:flagellar biosynthesis protein FliR